MEEEKRNIFEKIIEFLYSIVIIVGFFANAYAFPKILFFIFNIQEEVTPALFVITLIIEFYIVGYYMIQEDKRKKALTDKHYLEIANKDIEIEKLKEKLKKYEN